MTYKRIEKEVTPNGTYYSLYYQNEDSYDVYTLFKDENGIREVYVNVRGLSYKVNEGEDKVKELEKELRKYDLRNIFRTNKKLEEEKGNLERRFKLVKRDAEAVKVIEEELERYLKEEITIKKKRLKHLELNNFSEDLYYTMFKKKKMDHNYFTYLVEEVLHRKVGSFL